jgi:pimeloyl-ACP methyl ester carboxylesterase
MKRKFYFLSTFLMLSSTFSIDANICAEHSDVECSEDFDGFELVTAVKTDQSGFIRDMAITSAAAYNDRNLVNLTSGAIRKQEGNDCRNQLAESKEVISFSSNIPGYGNVPAGILTHEVDASGKHKITIAFHGTESKLDLMTDLTALKRSADVIGLPGYAHKGFLDRYMQSREALIDVINDRLEAHGKNASEVEFNITGHSLGGALATLCAADLKMNFAKISQVNLVTFSSPRVLESAGAETLNTALALASGKNLRIWRACDPISAVSIGTRFGFGFITGYRHVGEGVKLAAEVDFLSMKNHAHDLHVRDAISATPVKILEHTGWRDSFSNAVSSVKSTFTSFWGN